MKSSLPKLVPIASLVKRHSFKENKWKALALSGSASAWFEKISALSLAEVAPLDGLHPAEVSQSLVPVRIEVPMTQSAEFYLIFEESFVPKERSLILVERSLFPSLAEGEFYLCDILGEEVQSELGPFYVRSYYENGDGRSGVSMTSLVVESRDPIEGEILRLEAPLISLKRKDDSWYLEDLKLWYEAQYVGTDTPDE